MRSLENVKIYKRLGYPVTRCLSQVPLLYILLYILLGNVEGCQKVKHCFTFIVYNDVHYHISSLLLSSKTEKLNKPR